MSSHEFRINFVRIWYEFTQIHTNFTLVHPLICPNTRSTTPPNGDIGTALGSQGAACRLEAVFLYGLRTFVHDGRLPILCPFGRIPPRRR